MTAKRKTHADEKLAPSAINPQRPQQVLCAICKLPFLPWRRSGMLICTRDHPVKKDEA